METIDSRKITILTALDMSSAFDTLNHITLLLRLQHTFGLSGYVISWIRSYLTDRSSFVKIDSSSSPSTTILTGVPKGSVLGPLLFVLFISPIANVINPDQSNQNNTVSFHQYADDTQLYIGTNSSTLTTQIASIESCTQRVHNWFLNNGLHLNPSKSEAIAFYITLHYITSFQTPITPTVPNGASTKSFKFSECELKKVSFQQFFEGISVCEFLKIGRKRIPCLRSGE